MHCSVLDTTASVHYYRFMMTQTKTTPICCRCGETCILGFEIRTYGPRDPETGDQDEEIVCSECLDEEANRGDWDEYDAADTRFTQLFEEGEL